MEKLLGTIADKIPEPNGGFRRRITAGAIVVIVFLYCLYIIRAPIGNEKAAKSIFGFLTELSERFGNIITEPLVALLATIVIFAVGRIVEIYSELSYQSVFGFLLDSKQIEENLTASKIWDNLTFSGLREFCSKNQGIKPNVYIFSLIFAFISSIFGILLLLTTLAIKWGLLFLLAPMVFFAWSLNLMETYRKDVTGILPLTALTRKQSIALSTSSSLKTTSKTRKTSTPLKADELQQIIWKPFDRSFETLWIFIKQNLKDIDASELKRRERNFHESLVISSSIFYRYCNLFISTRPCVSFF